MANPDSDVATGWSIVFATSSFAGQLLDIEPYSMTRESLQTSHQGTTSYHTFTPASLADSGSMRITGFWQVDDATPITGAPETITLTSPAAQTIVGTGHFESFDVTASLETMQEFSATIKWSGALDINSSS